MIYSATIIDTVIGNLMLISRGNKLFQILFPDQEITIESISDLKKIPAPVLVETEKQLQEYFAGERKKFDLDLDLEGTDFQKQVWLELLKIPFGSTISYQELALRNGSEKKARAVGSANGKNPIPIIVPCHRVISKSGKLGGYAGGLDIKKKLLDLESK